MFIWVFLKQVTKLRMWRPCHLAPMGGLCIINDKYPSIHMANQRRNRM